MVLAKNQISTQGTNGKKKTLKNSSMRDNVNKDSKTYTVTCALKSAGKTGFLYANNWKIFHIYYLAQAITPNQRPPLSPG